MWGEEERGDFSCMRFLHDTHIILSSKCKKSWFKQQQRWGKWQKNFSPPVLNTFDWQRFGFILSYLVSSYCFGISKRHTIEMSNHRIIGIWIIMLKTLWIGRHPNNLSPSSSWASPKVLSSLSSPFLLSRTFKHEGGVLQITSKSKNILEWSPLIVHQQQDQKDLINLPLCRAMYFYYYLFTV